MPEHNDADLFIGMPVYNGRKYLRAALDSILAQSYKRFVLFVSDNASTDGSTEIILEYAALDSRIRYARQAVTLPPQDHFLSLLNRATEPYFMWAACDDLWHTDFCAKLVGRLSADPSLALAFCPYGLIDEQGAPLGLVRAPDYAGRTIPGRITRIAREWDDGMFYGVFRRDAVAKLEFPVYWGPNKRVVLNVAYPPLCYALSRGGYALVGTEPMWFNRIHTSKHYTSEAYASKPLRELAAVALRKTNVGVECLRQIVRGSDSYLAAAASVPGLWARLSWDTGTTAAHTLRAMTRRRAVPSAGE